MRCFWSVRDASGLVRDDEIAEHYKGLTEKTRNLSASTTQFSGSCYIWLTLRRRRSANRYKPNQKIRKRDIADILRRGIQRYKYFGPQGIEE
jgi:hypothetical protein